jgi:hypothetical protein
VRRCRKVSWPEIGETISGLAENPTPALSEGFLAMKRYTKFDRLQVLTIAVLLLIAERLRAAGLPDLATFACSVAANLLIAMTPKQKSRRRAPAKSRSR